MMNSTSTYFGKLKDGREAKLFCLENNNGMKVFITNYGGIITKIIVEDKKGKFCDVTLGFDNVEEYEKESPYFGAIVGRFGNRIKAARFNLDGKEFRLNKNDGENSLHSGIVGFDKVFWNVTTLEYENEVGLILSYLSTDGEEGFPGNLNVEVKYILNNSNEIVINYKATTDKPTICNLTNHAYFNLKDGGSSSIIDHKIKINADKISPIGTDAIPIEDYMNVSGTPFDLIEFTNIEKNINQEHQQIINGKGFDHNFVLSKEYGDLAYAAEARDEESGRFLQIFTTEPGIQFYTGNYLNGTLVGKNGIKYNKRSGFCLETQHFPDSPNRPNYPSTVLRPGEVYNSTTIYKFGIIQ